MDIEQVQEQFIREHWTSDSGIISVGIGTDTAGQPCLVVCVLDEGSKARIPNSYTSNHGTVTVTVMVSGEVMPY